MLHLVGWFALVLWWTGHQELTFSPPHVTVETYMLHTRAEHWMVSARNTIIACCCTERHKLAHQVQAHSPQTKPRRRPHHPVLGSFRPPLLLLLQVHWCWDFGGCNFRVPVTTKPTTPPNSLLNPNLSSHGLRCHRHRRCYCPCREGTCVPKHWGLNVCALVHT